MPQIINIKIRQSMQTAFLKSWHNSNKSLLYPLFIWSNVTLLCSQVNPPVPIARRTIPVHIHLFISLPFVKYISAILFAWHVVLTLQVSWQMFCVSLVLLHLLHAVTINVLLHMSFKYLESSNYVLCHCLIFSNHPLLAQFCYQICFLEFKTTYIFNVIKQEQV